LNLLAGTIICSGTVSNKLAGGPGKPLEDGGSGYSCIAELRMIETIEAGSPMISSSRKERPRSSRVGSPVFFDRLLDRPEDRMAGMILHL
ncbi:hypothetical protein AB9F35_34195, partial [Rhizobium leguminosarum]